MADLLSSLDVVSKNFSRQMMGYNTTEVDDFLDVIAESIQAYVQRIKELERTLDEANDRLTKYDTIKDNLQDALLSAQQSAKEKVENASREAEGIVRDAETRAEDIAAQSRVRADRIVREAEDEASSIAIKVSRLKELEDRGISQIRTFITDIERVLVSAQSGAPVELPEIVSEFVRRGAERRDEPAPQHAPEPEPAPEVPAHDETKKEEISQTLNALGIDPSLIDPTA